MRTLRTQCSTQCAFKRQGPAPSVLSRAAMFREAPAALLRRTVNSWRREAVEKLRRSAAAV